MGVRLATTAISGMGLLALLVACGGTAGTSSGSSSAAPSGSGEFPTSRSAPRNCPAWDSEAHGFVDGFNAAYRDAKAAFADFTDDAAILDPSNGDYRIARKSEVVARWDSFVQEYPDYSARTAGGYLDLSAAAFLTEVGVPPRWQPRCPTGSYTSCASSGSPRT